ncbi:MAG: alpha-N-acetylglucosaminidase, partial [Verrucomicrobiota bacterium]
MKIGRILRTVVAVCFAAGAAWASPEESARGVLERFIGERAGDFALESIPKAGEKDVYEISASEGKVRVAGSSGVAICRGAYDYLKETCNVLFSWEGKRIDLPESFPDYAKKRVECPHQYVHYLNQCTFSYSMPWWKWNRWEQEIDWMALHGINMPLAMFGQEMVWERVWKEFGMTDEDLAEFFSGPAYLPFFHMGCLYEHEGPLPGNWIEQQNKLQKRILARERELGMTPVSQAFAGFVPYAFAKAHPELNIIKGDEWCMFESTLILSPSEPMFVEIGKRFIEEYTKEYGTDHLYMSDTFIEMKPTFPAETRLQNYAEMGEGVYRAIAAADPDGVWIMMGWPFIVLADYWGEEEIEAMFSKVPQD